MISTKVMGGEEPRAGKLNWKQISETGRSRSSTSSLVLLAIVGGLISPAVALSAPRARGARSRAVTDTAYLKLVHQSGEYITEEGQATGTLPGHVRLLLEVGATIVAHFTIQADGGSISGVGSGRLKGGLAEPSFGGKMKVSHGTGLYRRAHGDGGFYGTLNRHTYKMIVQTTGTLDY